MSSQDDTDWLAAQFAGEALLANPPKGMEDRILSDITSQMAAAQPTLAPGGTDAVSSWSLSSVWLKSIVASMVVAGFAGLYFQSRETAAGPEPAAQRQADSPPATRREPAYPPSMADETPKSVSALAPGHRVDSAQTSTRTTPSTLTLPRAHRRPNTSRLRRKKRLSKRRMPKAPSVRSPTTTVVVQTRAPAPLPSADEAQTAPATTQAAPRDLALRAERRLLSAAVGAIRAANLPQAQRVLNAYAARFPAGQLEPEYRLVQIRLHLANGRPAAARADARAFVKKYPSSGLRQTIERLVK